MASKVGLHARPAAIVAKAAAAQSVSVTIRKDGCPPVEAGSILGLMALGASYGDEVVLAADGAGAEAALNHIAELVEKDMDSE